jgi:guanylate kinase
LTETPHTPRHQTLPLPRQGVPLVLSSPSGAGKTTLAKALLAQDAGIVLSVSVTTRAMRPGEVDGRDYFFISKDEFFARRDAGDLLEWAEVHGNFYATPKAAIDDHLTAGRDVLFDIDWQGAQQLRIRSTVPIASVFILPPSAAVLKERLERRAQDSAAVVAKRLAGAAAEIAHWHEYDYSIINVDLAQSIATLVSILAAERARRTRTPALAQFVTSLQT